ncbi:hypothetical protein [Actinomadura terrae]|uniref:hypothetical protein n=1 Tax=Actinomadura terrae TaxID=604353 RepID=UPI001FA7AF33|nr:hypothetical protein [Actinomadura terrae]
MSVDRSPKSPRISHTDPLPAYQPPEGRWAEPYQRYDDELWTVHLRCPEMIVGDDRLVDTLTASSESALAALMAQQDELAQRKRPESSGT